MADDINIKITGDNKPFKKVLKESQSLIAKFDKANKTSSDRRLKAEKRTNDAILRHRTKMLRRSVQVEKRTTNQIDNLRRKSERKAVKKGGIVGLGGLGLGKLGTGLAVGAGALLVGRTMVKAVKEISDFDTALTRLSVRQGVTIDQQKQLREALNNVSISSSISRDVLLEVSDAILRQSGNIEFLNNNLENVAKQVLIYGEDAKQEIGDLLGSIAKFSKTSKDINEIETFNIIMAQAGLVNVEIEDLAKNTDKLFEGFRLSGKKGISALTQYTALFNTISELQGTRKAATTVKGFFEDLERQAKKLKKLGIEIYAPTGDLLETQDIMENLLRITEGNNKKLIDAGITSTNLLNVNQALGIQYKENNGQLTKTRGLINAANNALTQQEEKYKRLRSDSGTIFKSFSNLKTVLTDDLLKESLKGFSESIGTIDTTAMNELRDTFKLIGESLAGILETMNALGWLGGRILGSGIYEEKAERAQKKANLIEQYGRLLKGPQTERVKELRKEIETKLGTLNIEIQISPEGKLLGFKRTDTGKSYINKVLVESGSLGYSGKL